jgi:hypothetical protein
MKFDPEPFDAENVQAGVAARNALRAKATLPPVSVDGETRMVQAHHEVVQFARFMETPLRELVEAKMLARLRRRYGADFTPHGVLSGGGYVFYVMVRGLMRKLYDRRYARTAASVRRRL